MYLSDHLWSLSLHLPTLPLLPRPTNRWVVFSETEVQGHQRGAGPRPQRHDFHVIFNKFCLLMSTPLNTPTPPFNSPSKFLFYNLKSVHKLTLGMRSVLESHIFLKTDIVSFPVCVTEFKVIQLAVYAVCIIGVLNNAVRTNVIRCMEQTEHESVWWLFWGFFAFSFETSDVKSLSLCVFFFLELFIVQNIHGNVPH